MVVVVVDVVVTRRVRVGVETWLSQLVQRTRLETFRQSRVVVTVDVVVVVVIVFVGAYSPVTGNHARQLRGSTPRDDVGPMNPVVMYSGTRSCCSWDGAGEGRAVSGDALSPLGVNDLPDKGVDALPDKGVDAPSDKGVGAPPDKGVGSLPEKGFDAPPDNGSRTSPCKDSAGAIRVARLLLALSSDVMATDDKAMRAFSTGCSSFAIPHISSATGPPEEMACSARGVNGQGRVFHPSVAAVETGPNGRTPSSSTRAFGGLARRLDLSRQE